MRKYICLLSLCLASLAMSAQETEELKSVQLQSGISITGSVSRNPDGTVSVTTSDGDVLFYQSSEVKSIRSLNSLVKPDQVLYSRKGKLYLKTEMAKEPEKLSEDKCRMILSDELFAQFKKSRSRYKCGKTLEIIGTISCAAGIGIFTIRDEGFFIEIKDEGKHFSRFNYEAVIPFSIGAAMLVPGVILKHKAKKQLNGIADRYNSNNDYSVRLGLSPSFMLTAQNDVSLGVSMSLTF